MEVVLLLFIILWGLSIPWLYSWKKFWHFLIINTIVINNKPSKNKFAYIK